MRRRRAHEWRPIAQVVRHRDPHNALFWQRSSPGRPPTEWEATLLAACGPDWWDLAGHLSSVQRRDWAARMLSAWGYPQAANRAAEGEAVRCGEVAIARQHAPPDMCSFPLCSGWSLEVCTDAKAVAEAAVGKAKPPACTVAGSAASRSMRCAVLHCAKAASEGVQ